MAWLIEAAIDPESIKKAIENHQREMENDRALAQETIAKINKQTAEQIEKNPDYEDRFELIKTNKIKNVYKGMEFSEKKHTEAIEKLKKEYEKL